MIHDFMNMGFRYDWSGKFTSQSVWRHPIANNPTWEIVHMLKGEAYMYEGERVFTASEGSTFLLKPDTEHGGTADSPGEVSFFWMHFFSPAEHNEKLRSLPQNIEIGSLSQIPLLFRQLLHFSAVSSYPDSVSDSLVGMLVTEYAVQSESNPGGHEERLISDICEWIRINSNRKLTAAEVSRQFCYNSDYLSRLFKQRFGVGLKAWIDTSRIELIRNLLLTTDKPLKSIAAETGFDDYKAFLKFYTYHETISPTEVRELYYKTHTNNW